jgi:peroxiredoxin family protein
MSEKTGAGNPPAFELVLTKSPMAGKQEQKVEQKPVAAKAQPVKSPAPTVAPPVAKVVPPPAKPGFEHIANIPVVFCASREIAKGLLVDMFALIGTLNAMETGNVNIETLPVVLQNAQRILTNMSDVMIRDCGVTDADLDDVMNVFKEVNAEVAKQVTQPVQPEKQEQKVTVESPKKEQKTTAAKPVPSNIL